MSEEYTLYGTPFSMYTGKARAYFQVKDIPYNEEFASLKVFKNIIIPKTGTRFIPVVKTPDNLFLQDTATIIDEIETKSAKNAIVPTLPKRKIISLIFELWADEWLIIPAMHYRWNKDNFPFLYQEFGRIVAPHMPSFVRGYLGKKVAQRFKGYVPALGITDRMIPSIESWFENTVLHYLNAHFERSHFVLGDTPTLADVSLMGPLFAHMYFDPAPKAMMEKIAPNVCDWIKRMQNTTLANLTDEVDDYIPETLTPILTNIFEEHWPVLLNTVIEIEEWANTYPDEHDVPRSIGRHGFRIGHQKGSRAILPFSQWKLQRVLDTYQQLPESDKRNVDELLVKVRGADAMQFKINKRVALERGRLKLI
ncbi:glutathione S-transferase [Aestuariibacter sp. AA17]|uniref:Glutathione S-transferase n=1 Tax=Fluctibacter corallii TaxID=2984329 RepID=A0ABT3ABR8_9ALTE|nr:glutathione S-transferase family protein [Aestuariibacter sp. AA17]MCV2886122.1 glutathione S-transferase [Aestuariibacter sp. AA17]